MALWAEHRGFVSDANATLDGRAQAVVDGGADLSGLDLAYPPLPTVLAMAPGGALVLAVVACATVGIAMQLVCARLVRRRLPMVLTGLLLLSVMAVPAVVFEVTQDLRAVMALSFLVIAIDGFVRFVARGDTIGGFVAGLMLALAFLCDPIALVYAVALGVAAPFVSPSAVQREPGWLTAISCVLLFPVAAAVGCWAFLEWRFTGGAFATIRVDTDWFGFPGGVRASLDDALADTGGVLARCPVYLCIAGLLVRRKAVAAIGYLVPPLALAVAYLVGMTYPAALGMALLSLIGLYSVPQSANTIERRLLAAAAVIQLAVALSWQPAGPEFDHWVNALF